MYRESKATRTTLLQTETHAATETCAEDYTPGCNSNIASAFENELGSGNDAGLGSAPCPSNAHTDTITAGDIVVIRFRESPYLGYVRDVDGVKVTVVPLRMSDVATCSWVKAGKAVAKTLWECIKIPSRLSDMRIQI